MSYTHAYIYTYTHTARMSAKWRRGRRGVSHEDHLLRTWTSFANNADTRVQSSPTNYNECIITFRPYMHSTYMRIFVMPYHFITSTSILRYYVITLHRFKLNIFDSFVTVGYYYEHNSFETSNILVSHSSAIHICQGGPRKSGAKTLHQLRSVVL